MTIYLGDFPTGKTIYVPFHTFNSSGASVTITGLAVTDIEVYRNGSVTQRASDAGYALLDTDGIDFDGLTGIHGFSIDTSDNTDAGFYAAGYDYWVVVSAITVDAQTVSFVAAIFSIDNRQLLRPTTSGRTLDVSAGGEAGIDWANVGSPTTTLNLSGTSTKALEPTTAGRTLDVTTTGEAGLDFANVNMPVGQIPIAQILDNGTMQAGSAAGTAVLRSGFSAGADDRVIGATLWITGGTGAGQRRIVHDSVDTTDTVSISPNWDATPDNTSTYILYPTPPAPTNAAALATTLVSTGTGTGQVNLSSGAVPVTGDFTATMKTSIGTAVAASAVASVTGNVGGNVAGSVGSVATGGITAASIATGAIDADAIAADAVTEIQSGLATAAALATVDGIVDTLVSGVITGAAATGTLSTTQATSNLTGYADDQLIGRVIIWLTGNCEGEATDITDYASASGLLTFTALTTAPGNGDTFKIV